MTPFKITFLFVIAAFAGITIAWTIPVSPERSSSIPSITVLFSFPNSPPETIEFEVTSAFENALSNIPGLQKIYSISGNGYGSVEMTLKKDIDIDFTRLLVSSKIREIYPKLNSRISYPSILPSNNSNIDQPLIVFQVRSKLSPHESKRILQEQILPKLLSVRGVKKTLINGTGEFQICVNIDKDKLNAFHFSVSEIAEAIQQTSTEHHFGTAALSGGILRVKSEQLQLSPQSIADIKIPYSGTFVRIRDFASVYLEETPPTEFFRMNGESYVTASIFPYRDINLIYLARELRKEIEQVAEQLPPDYSIEVSSDQTISLEKEIGQVIIRIAQAITLILFAVLMYYRKIQYVGLFFVMILINIGITFLFIYIFHVTLTFYAIAGWVIALAILISNGAWIVDNLRKRKKKNKIFNKTTLVSSLVMSYCLLFISLLLDEDWIDLKEFSKLVSISLLVSYLIAAYFIPAYFKITKMETRLGFIVDEIKQKNVLVGVYFRVLTFLARQRITVIAILLLIWGIPYAAFSINGNEEDRLGTRNNWWYVLTHNRIILAVTGGTVSTFNRNQFERLGIRSYDKTRLSVYATLPTGNTINEMNMVMKGIENLLKTEQQKISYSTQVTSGQNGSLTIEFENEWESTSFPLELRERLLSYSLNQSGVDWNIIGLGKAFSNSSPEEIPHYTILLKGYDYRRLVKTATTLAEELERHKRISHVNVDRKMSMSEMSTQEYGFRIDLMKVYSHGVRATEVSSSLSEMLGENTFQISLDNLLTNVVIKEDRSSIYSKKEFMTKIVPTSKTAIQMDRFITMNLQSGTSPIHKENRQYLRQLNFNYHGSNIAGLRYVDSLLNNLTKSMPLGFSAKRLSNAIETKKIDYEYVYILILMSTIWLLCLVILENIPRATITIFIAMLSFIGIFMAFGSFDIYFDQGGFLSFIIVIGISVNNLFIILSLTNKMTNSSCIHYNKFLVYTLSRSAPTLVFAIVIIIIALAPFTSKGTDEVFWFAFAIGTISGLVFFAFLSFFLVPILLWRNQILTPRKKSH